METRNEPLSAYVRRTRGDCDGQGPDWLAERIAELEALAEHRLKKLRAANAFSDPSTNQRQIGRVMETKDMHERIAKIERTTLGYEDHGIFTCVLHLNYGGSCQDAGRDSLDEYNEESKRRVGTAFGMDWIIRAMKACGVDEWSKVKGRTVIALFDSDGFHEPVRGIKPLPTEPGEPFMFEELASEHYPAKAR